MESVQVALSEVSDGDLPQVGEFLHRTLNERVSPSAWADAFSPRWPVPQPNHGFQLRAGDDIVGVYMALYSERQINGEQVRFCNLAAWSMEQTYRAQGVRLIRAMLKQPGYHFTDLSPSGSVVEINERLRFRRLDTTTALCPTAAWPPLGRDRVRVITSPDTIEGLLRGQDRQIFLDHRSAAAARHVVLVAGDDHCYVVYRRDRRKRLPLFASLLYVGEPRVLRGAFGALARHVAARGVAVLLVEPRVAGFRPDRSKLLTSPRVKMYRSPTLEPEDVDYLYSELTNVSW